MLDKIMNKDKITSIDLLEQINFFREQENTPKTNHKDLIIIIETEFTDINRKRAEGGVCPEMHMKIKEQLLCENIEIKKYIHPQNKQLYPMYIMPLSKAKQILIKESKFVRKAVIQYIEKLELELNKPLSVEEMIISQAKSVIELKNKFEVLEDKVNNRMTIESGEQTSLQFKIKARVYERFDTYDKEELKKEIVKLLFSNIHKELKKKFGVPSYKDVKVKDFEDCLNFVKVWREDQSIREKINEL